jgi:DNA-binding PadR family transcriptional regulator
MAKKSASKYALLGLLSWEPMSGYDIKKHFDEFVQFFWSESYGNIYPTLKRLLKKGLVTRRVEKTSGKPDRVIYTITPAGKKDLIDWYSEPIPAPKIRSELLLRLYFGESIPVSHHTDMIKNLHVNLLKAKPIIDNNEKVYKKKARKSKRDYLTYLTFRQGYLFFQARLKWCEEVLEIMEKGKLEPKDIS